MTGGNLPDDLTKKVDTLLDEFLECTNSEVRARQLRSAIVRSMLPCNLVVILDAATLWVAAQKQAGDAINKHTRFSPTTISDGGDIYCGKMGIRA